MDTLKILLFYFFERASSLSKDNGIMLNCSERHALLVNYENN